MAEVVREEGSSQRRDSMEESLLKKTQPDWAHTPPDAESVLNQEWVGPSETDYALRPMPEVDEEPRRRFGEHAGYPLRRFVFRGIIGVIIPPIVLVYYLLLWYFYLPSDDPRIAIPFGPPGGQLVFYGWFLIGIVGLNLSKFGLTGIEATMLMHPFWSLRNAMQIMAHAEHTWSGPSGWLKFFQTLFSKERTTMMPSRLWILLALLSSILFVSLPISGLVFELGDGFIASSNHPEVVGFTPNNFNLRVSSEVVEGAGKAWAVGIPARVPGIGTIYTPATANANSSAYAALNELKGALPFSDGVQNIFLTQQAESPVSGRSWGVLLRYNCSTVTKLADFKILSKRNSSAEILPGVSSLLYNPEHDMTKQIMLANHTLISDIVNYQAYFEIANDNWPFGSGASIDPLFASSAFPRCYFNASKNPSHSYFGIDTDQTIEVAMMQRLTRIPDFLEAPLVPANLSISGTISELEKEHLRLFNYQNNTEPIHAIGVTCSSSSAVGTAELDGRFASFDKFEASDTLIPKNPLQCAQQLHYGALNLIENAFLQEDSKDLDDLYTSFGGPRAQLLNFPGESTGELARLSFVQPDDLRKSMIMAYASYAVQMMYNGGQGVSFGDVIDNYKFVHENVTAFVPHKAVERGVVPPLIPAIMLALWAAGSLALAIFYGFQRRWAETLDSYSMFRFGADLSGVVKNNPDFAIVKSFEETEALLDLPGFIGDAQPEFSPGHISLVHRGVAPKTKNYL